MRGIPYALAAICALGDPAETQDGAWVLQAPITTWDEALPLGNGTLGGLLWGEGRELRLSLDKNGLWDLRQHPIVDDEDWNYATMQRLVREGDQAEIVRRFDGPYNLPWPTKLPCGRLELVLPEGVEVTRFELDLRAAEGLVDLGASGRARGLFRSDAPVALFELPLTGIDARIVRPEALAKLDYPGASSGTQITYRNGERLEANWIAQRGVGDDPRQPFWVVAVARAARDGEDPGRGDGGRSSRW